MDQPELAHHNTFHVDEDHLNLLKPPAISLRSMSKSDPHLSIPHLLVSQDEAHPSLNRIVSGLFHVDSALRTPHASCGNLQALHKGDSVSVLGNTMTLPDKSNNISQPLRKSSSAVDWSGAVAETSRRHKQQYGWHGALYRIADDPSSTQSIPLALSEADHHQDVGLVMNAPAGQHHNVAVVNSQMSGGHFSDGLVASAATLNQPSPSVPLDMHSTDRQQSHGVFGGVFHRGFFSKPVLRSEEENYRYLMALDR